MASFTCAMSVAARGGAPVSRGSRIPCRLAQSGSARIDMPLGSSRGEGVIESGRVRVAAGEEIYEMGLVYSWKAWVAP